MNKYKFVVSFLALIMLTVFIPHGVFALENTSTTTESGDSAAVLASVGVSMDQNDEVTTEIATAAPTSTATSTADDSLALIAGAIGVAIPWESVGVLGIILLAILLGLWGVYRKENVRDWHH